jgi:ubiquitin-conjugating enzyme E2 I
MRLQEERKQWRKDHPYVCSHICTHSSIVKKDFCRLRFLAERCYYQGFWARPQKIGDTLNLLTWEAGIPGKEGVSFPFFEDSLRE